MTSRELARLQDKVVELAWPINDSGQSKTMTVHCRVLDGRAAYGRLDVLVTPLDGSGQAWVSADRVKVRGK